MAVVTDFHASNPAVSDFNGTLLLKLHAAYTLPEKRNNVLINDRINFIITLLDKSLIV
jgi:hypothetical protein|tara:strand:+ start:732 stop:905 length:174 start_codon:yes stop_codon:yes gene_type:complete